MVRLHARIAWRVAQRHSNHRHPKTPGYRSRAHKVRPRGGRPVTDRELSLGLAFLAAGGAPERLTRWEQYAQVLLSANEFMYVD